MAPLMALFPPGKGGRGRCPRGERQRPPHPQPHRGPRDAVANRTTPANGDERAQVLPRLEAVKGRPGKRGAPANVSRSSRQIKGMLQKPSGSSSGSVGSGHSSGSASGRPRKIGETDQKSRPTIPSRADLCLVPEDIPSLGGAVGSVLGSLR